MNSPSLPVVTEEHLEEFRTVSRQIEDAVVAKMLNHAEQLDNLEDEAEKVIRSGYRFTVEMLESIMAVGEPALLNDQMAWASDRLPVYGVPHEHVNLAFIAYKQAFAQKLSEDAAKQILPYFDWLITKQKELLTKE